MTIPATAPPLRPSEVVGLSVGAFVGDFVGDVGDFVGDFVGDVVGDSVGDFVGGGQIEIDPPDPANIIVMLAELSIQESPHNTLLKLAALKNT